MTIAIQATNDAPTITPIGATPQSATISITADNTYSLYVNGTLIGSDVEWTDVETYTTTLQAGDVVAIEAADADGITAMIAAIDFAGVARAVSGADWRISTTLETDWKTNSFDDAHWNYATSFGDRTTATWFDSLSADPAYEKLETANWIWDADNNNVEQVFFRYVVSDAPSVQENAADGTTGTITVADGSLLDYETATSHTMTIRSSDAGGLFDEQVVTVNLTDVNETPISVDDAATAVEAGGTANAAVSTNPTGDVLHNDTDVDVGDLKDVVGVVVGPAAIAVGSVNAVVDTATARDAGGDANTTPGINPTGNVLDNDPDPNDASGRFTINDLGQARSTLLRIGFISLPHQ